MEQPKSSGVHHGIDYMKPNLDTTGKTYIAVAAVYSLIVFSGLTALFKLRKTHAVRIRNFTLICCTVVFLHVYLLLILLVYPLNGLFTCSWEFWIMSIWLPFGMALFQGEISTLLFTSFS
jgi:hypothetical protein